MTAFYLEGSIALDGFNERFSDIDFIAVLSRKAVPAELDTLSAIHKILEKHYPRWKLSGTYLQPDGLIGRDFSLNLMILDLP